MGWFEDATKGVNKFISNPAQALGIKGGGGDVTNAMAGLINPMTQLAQGYDKVGRGKGTEFLNDPTGLSSSMGSTGKDAMNWISNPGGALGQEWYKAQPDSEMAKQYARYSNLDDSLDTDVQDYWKEEQVTPDYSGQLKQQQEMMAKQREQQGKLSQALKRANAASAAKGMSASRGSYGYAGASDPAKQRAYADAVSAQSLYGQEQDANLAQQKMMQDYQMKQLEEQYRLQAEQDRVNALNQARANQQGALQTAGSVVGSLFGA